jgi:hypothetical protein
MAVISRKVTRTVGTNTVILPLALNRNQIAVSQQQKPQEFQNNMTSSSLSFTNQQQQPTGISFEIGNTTLHATRRGRGTENVNRGPNQDT